MPTDVAVFLLGISVLMFWASYVMHKNDPPRDLRGI